MPRLSPARFPPGFFDLPSDAGQSLPLELIASWIRSPQTPEAARLLLEPCTLQGIVVTSDTSGLTRLSQERSLIELLAMISRPKELIHAFGRAIGGTAVGVWAADNTAMFYPASVPADQVTSMLLALTDRIREECEVGIGMAVHHGTFYEMGSGLHGADADLVESLAEDHARAGEILITADLRRLLGENDSFEIEYLPDIPLSRETYRVVDGLRLENIEPSEFRYPLPFTDEFFEGLSAFQRTRRTSVVPRPAYRDGFVVVVEREREDRQSAEVATLNDLALAAAIARAGRLVLEEFEGIDVKSAGGAGIYYFEHPRRAYDFARHLREFFQGQQVQLSIGIDMGRVLLFELGTGRYEVAGSPVNVASKLAQDAGKLGAITLTWASARAAGIPDSTAVQALAASGMTIEAVRT
jgi:class 3 adenylate cyclase